MPQCAQCGHASADAFAFCPSCGTRSHPGTGRGLIGRILNGKYRVMAEIGQGSMGTVYLGEHTALHRKIALKVLHDTLLLRDDVLQRFQREGIAAGRLDHPNAIQIFDFDRTEDGLYFLAMEHVRGENLRQRLQRTGSMPVEQAVLIMQQLAAALQQAHEQGIVHRDLKPENLMVVEGQDGGLQLKVLDFGLSRLVDRQQGSSLMTMPGHVMGTPLYMAPEQWRGEEADHRTDLYAACLILYELVSGRHPFQGANMTEIFVKATTEEPPSLLAGKPVRELPRGLDELLQQGLGKHRDERFQSAHDLAVALQGIDFQSKAHARTAKTRRRGPPTTTRRSARRPPAAEAAPSRRWWLWGGVAAAAAAIAVVAVLMQDGSSVKADGPLASLRPESERSASERAYLALLETVRDHWRANELPAALMAADKAKRHESADAEAFVVRGEVYLRQGEYDLARADYRDALQRLPRYAAAEAGLGWVAFQRGDLDAAMKQFEAAVKADPDHADGHAGKGAVLCRNGDFAAACQVLDPVAARALDVPRVHLYRGEAHLGMDRPDQAVEAFVQCRRTDPSLTEAAAGLGDAYYRKNELDNAEKQYRYALHDPRVRRKLAELLLASGRTADAGTVLQPALEAGAKDGALYALQGMVAQARGDGTAAITALERALELGAPEPAHVHLLLGTLLFENQRYGDAAKQMEHVTDADEGLAAAWRTWGLALFRMGEYSTAALRLERARKLDPKDTLVLYTLGVLYMDYLMRPDDAAAQFRAYQAAGGRDAKVSEWLQRLR